MTAFYSTTYSSPVGALTLCREEENLTGLWIAGQKYHGESIPDVMIPEKDCTSPVFTHVKAWLDAYFARKCPSLSHISLAPYGSTFRRLVWRLLTEIPYGETTTYGALAKTVAQKLNKPHMASLAIGGAVGHNPISLIIPCHRVIGSDGNLTGYAGGIDRKLWLLQHEGIDVSSLHMPKR